MRKTIRKLNKIEKILVAFLGLIVLFAGYKIGLAFYMEHSHITPVNGGVYTEGVVGKMGILNPLLVHQGTVSHDMTQLIFSGLTKYDTETREIVSDIANYKVSSNGKEYTFVIKENATWHDGKPVTADDVLFTYNSIIKNPEFSGAILTYNDYTGIKIIKIDDRTVQFLLERPDSFFLVKTITGLLPKHLMENEPIEFFETAPFNFMPIGSGRYKFITQTSFGNHTEISLEAFEDFYDGQPHIENIMIKVFTDFKDLMKNIGELDGVRNVPYEYTEKILSKGLTLERYQLPQYVAVFMNNESDKLKGSKVRLALQLGTDKENLIEEIGQHQIIDTPLLEIDQGNWMHQYSVNKANGALFDTQWKIPEPEDETAEVTEEDEEDVETPLSGASPEDDETDTVPPPDKDPNDTSEVTFINSPNEGKDWKTTQDRVTITGTAPKNTKTIFVDDYELKKYVPGDPGWSYVASEEFDNLKLGKNIYKVFSIDFNEEKKLIDAITITYGSAITFTEDEKVKLAEENAVAPELPIRINKDGEELSLNLITSKKPETYAQVAEILKKQWKKIGVDVKVIALDNGEFQERVNKHEYDLLIFGQNLGYNLDAYPYWHSSQAKEGGYNLSQFKNFVVDSLLEKARYERVEEDRKKTLSDIQYIISQEAPAVFLYSPTYYLALSEKVQNTSFENLATTSDRFAAVETWYAKVDRKLKKGVNPITFFTWMIKQF
jgi:ABC-type transport system substrate-binding protein